MDRLRQYRPGLRFYLFTRFQDFNRPATRALSDAMRQAGLKVTLVEQPGEHAAMTADEVPAALAWMANVE